MAVRAKPGSFGLVCEQREGLRPPPSSFRSCWSFVKMQASGRLVVVTSSSPYTQAEPGGFKRRSFPTSPVLGLTVPPLGQLHAYRPRSRTHLGAHPPAALARAHCFGARPLGRLRPRAVCCSQSPPPRMPAAAPICSAAAPAAGRPAPGWRNRTRTLALLVASLHARAQRGWEGRSPCSQPQPVT